MYTISATASAAERLAWLRDNKRAIMAIKHWRAIPELVEEIKTVNAEIRRMERAQKAAGQGVSNEMA